MVCCNDCYLQAEPVGDQSSLLKLQQNEVNCSFFLFLLLRKRIRGFSGCSGFLMKGINFFPSAGSINSRESWGLIFASCTLEGRWRNCYTLPHLGPSSTSLFVCMFFFKAAVLYLLRQQLLCPIKEKGLRVIQELMLHHRMTWRMVITPTIALSTTVVKRRLLLSGPLRL